MRLTTKSRYGTRLLLDLAIYSKKKPVRLSDVSKRQRISLKYLEKLIRKLKLAGYVKSIRGPYGGYMLAKSTKDITVGDVVRVMEDSQTITDCTEKDNVCGICSRAGECLSQWIWSETANAMFEKLDSFKFDRLLTTSTQILKKNQPLKSKSKGASL